MSDSTREQCVEPRWVRRQDNSASRDERILYMDPDDFSFDGNWKSTDSDYNHRNSHDQDGVSILMTDSRVLLQDTPVPEVSFPQTSLNMHSLFDHTILESPSAHNRSITKTLDPSFPKDICCHTPERTANTSMRNPSSLSKSSRKASDAARSSGHQLSQGSANYLHIHADDHEQWKDWYWSAFEAVQQIACRQIAKEWIKTIHPKKQSTHPYNGRVAGQKVVLPPEDTKPPYWPKTVRHKEPDHIDKRERIELLVQLLTNTPYKRSTSSTVLGQDIDAETLLSALDRRRDEHIKNKWNIICEIVKARSQLEFPSEGRHVASPIIKVPDYRKLRDQKTNKVTNAEQCKLKIDQSLVMVPKVKRSASNDTNNDAEPLAQSTVRSIEDVSTRQLPRQTHHFLPMNIQNVTPIPHTTVDPLSIWSNDEWQAWAESYSGHLDSRFTIVTAEHGYNDIAADGESSQWYGSIPHRNHQGSQSLPTHSTTIQSIGHQPFTIMQTGGIAVPGMSNSYHVPAQKRLWDDCHDNLDSLKDDDILGPTIELSD